MMRGKTVMAVLLAGAVLLSLVPPALASNPPPPPPPPPSGGGGGGGGGGGSSGGGSPPPTSSSGSSSSGSTSTSSSTSSSSTTPPPTHPKPKRHKPKPKTVPTTLPAVVVVPLTADHHAADPASFPVVSDTATTNPLTATASQPARATSIWLFIAVAAVPLALTVLFVALRQAMRRRPAKHGTPATR